MNIKVIEIPDVSGGKDGKRKFILLDDGRLLSGVCMYHKDLSNYFFRNEEKKDHCVIGAGVVPDDPSTSCDEVLTWGKWVSTGYAVTTPLLLREGVRSALIDFYGNDKRVNK